MFFGADFFYFFKLGLKSGPGSCTVYYYSSPSLDINKKKKEKSNRCKNTLLQGLTSNAHFLYNQHFYTQRQAETGKKLSKS